MIKKPIANDRTYYKLLFPILERTCTRMHRVDVLRLLWNEYT